MHLITLTALAAVAAVSQTRFFPLSEVRAGMRGVGKTVFAGDRIEEFQVEILGVLENVGPRQSVILARLAGGPLADTGVMQGMSGSPVYLGGRLAGAVALAFPYAKEPLCGIRPIEEMLRIDSAPPAQTLARSLDPLWQETAAPRDARWLDSSRLVDIATPVSFSGFTTSTIDHFAPRLKAIGLEPRQGVSGGGRPASGPAALEPGAMISVQLLSGDLSAGADGTVTHVDGRRVYAFGHRFLSIGETQMPFARSEVLTLLPSLSSSFKIAAPRQWAGVVTQDRSTAIAGDLGRRAEMVPVRLAVTGPGRRTDYQMEMVNDRFLSPFLLQMAVYSAIDATEKATGGATFRLRGQIEFQNAPSPVKLDTMYAGDYGAPAQASLGVAVPVSFALQSGFADLKLRSVSVSVEAFETKKQVQIERVFPARAAVRPGETVDLYVAMAGDGGREITRRVSYTVPAGAAPGPLYFTVADGATINFTDYRNLAATPARSPAQVISLLNNLRGNTSAWLRVWRAEQNYQVQGEDLPSPPPSVALILNKAQASMGALPLARASRVDEKEIPLGDMLVSGSRTVQVEIKE